MDAGENLEVDTHATACRYDGTALIEKRALRMERPRP